MSQMSASLLFSSTSSLFISSSSSSLRRCKSRSSSSSPTKTHRDTKSNTKKKNNKNARAMSSSSSSSSSTEPDWKVKQREQDALIGKEETAVKTRVVEMLKPILEGADKVTSQGDDAAQLQLQGELSEKIRQATKMLEEGLVERDSQAHRGTAKSEIGRRLSAFTQGQYFERLLTRFSVPEELFGPLSMVGLEKDMYVRKIDGYLPTARVAFVDEIFKANSAILNSLLTILNERLFDNGNERIEVPLLCLVGASNELPESEELDALYDRFLLRSSVEQVSSTALRDLLKLSEASETKARADINDEQKFSLKPSDFQGVKEKACESTTVPDSVINLMTDLRSHLQDKCEPPIYVSDRRLLKAVTLLRVAAYTDGRSVVSDFDTLLLAHVLWQRPGESAMVQDWILERLAKERGVKQVQYLLAALFGRACRSDENDQEEAAQLLKEAQGLKEILTSQLNDLAGATAGGVPQLKRHVWLSPAESERAAQSLSPMFNKARKGLEKLLEECLTLEVALERKTEPHVMALLLPEYWADFIRSGPIEDVKPLGLK
ncbi:unnamed protein product [Bathycoccus prasinos]